MAMSISRARRRDHRTPIERAIGSIHGFEAGVRDFLALFRSRPPPRRRRPDSEPRLADERRLADDRRAANGAPMDLGSLGGPIPAIRGELINLTRPPPRPAVPRANTPRPNASHPTPPQQSAPRPAAPRQSEDWAGEERSSPVNQGQARPSQPHQSQPPQRQAHFGQAELDEARPAAARPSRRPEPQPIRSDQQRGEAQSSRSDFLAAYNLHKSFAKRKVVNDVNLYLRKGEAVGLLGPNGAGKTTVFYMITGLIKADQGRIELDGHDVTGLPMYQRARLGVGYLPQEASIFRGLNVEDNIRSVLEVIEPDRRRREADLDALLEEFGISSRRKTPAIALSGGERRRVEIARALASRPSYMLLDEPFAGIDPKAVVEIQRLVRHLTNRGIGVLITDHNVRETLALTDRSYIIFSGQVLMEGGKDEIVNDPEVRRLYLGEEFRME
jgi:lipopolysaccharide export system ATP-binding protein